MDEKVAEAPVSRWEIEYTNRRIERVEKKLKIIIALLVEKKMLGEALQKAIEETQHEVKETKIEWYLKQLNI